MANKKINQLVAKTTIQSTDLFPIGDATTGTLYKKTIADLQAAIGGAVISVNGLVGTVVLDADDILETASPTNRYFTEARARAAISLTTTGSSGASTYSSSTGVLNVPTYTLAGLGGITATFLSGGTGITYDSGTGVISYSGTVYTDSSIRGLVSAGTGLSYNSSTGVFTNTITQYTDALARAAISGTAPITYNSSTGAIGITQAGTSSNGFLSSTDWNTFNGKQNALTNPVTGTGTTNTLAKFTSSSAIGNSNITDTGSLITLGSNTTISSGGLQIGSNSLGFSSVRIGKNLTGSTTISAITSDGAIQSDVTSDLNNFVSGLRTAASTFTLGSFRHFQAIQSSIGAGSAITNQYGFEAASSLTGATNNFGFYGNIASGTGRWNIYMNGTANNYMGGRLALGSTAGVTQSSISNRLSITGNATSLGYELESTIQSDVTSEARGYSSFLSTAAATFTLGTLTHFRASQGSFQSGSTVSTQQGFLANSNMIGATNNYGFRGLIPSGTGRWNLYMDGTANNYLAGNLGVGTTTIDTYSNIGTGSGITILASATNTSAHLNLIGNGTGFGGLSLGNGTIRRAGVFGEDGSNLTFYTNASNSGTSLTERMRITSAGNVGIGTTSPSTYGFFTVNSSVDSAGVNIVVRNQTDTGGDNTRYAGINLIVGSDNGTASIRAFRTNSSTDYSTALSFWTKGPGGGPMLPEERGRITSTGNWLIATNTDNGERLYVNGAIRATGTITANSDITLKKNLAKIENALEKVEQINGYTYEFKADDCKRHAGVIAQEIEGVLPEIVNKGNDGLLGVEYGNISALLIEAIKDLKSKNELLEARLVALEK